VASWTRVDPKWLFCFRFVAFIFAFVSAGCNSSPDPSANVSQRPKSVQLPVGDPARCPEKCFSDGIAFARAALGLDPTEELRKYPTDPEKLLGTLKSEGESVGGAIYSVPLESLLDNLSVGPAQPTLLVDENGHLHLLLGKVDVDGQSFFQTVHGSSPPQLFSKQDILSAGFSSAWQLSGGNKGVPVGVGKCIIRFDKMFHNFGEIKPNSKLECTFLITNTGAVPVELARPITSCSCTSTLITESTKVEPGATIPFGVSMQSGNTGSFRQLVILKFREKEGSLPRQVVLSLFGCQRELRKLSTSRLNFGVVIPGHSYSRTVLIEEVVTDRFSIKALDSGEYPLTYKVEETISLRGCSQYRVLIELTPDDRFVGKQAGQITLVTDSRFAPNIPIGVLFEVPPLLSVRPSVLAFGEVYLGRSAELSVRFEPRTPGRVAVEIDPPPQGVNIRIRESSDGQPEMTVTLSPPRMGVWSGTIKGRAKIDGRALPFEIPCVAVGKEP
jgi:Protein of unknown function (DUF1573)